MAQQKTITVSVKRVRKTKVTDGSEYVIIAPLVVLMWKMKVMMATLIIMHTMNFRIHANQ